MIAPLQWARAGLIDLNNPAKSGRSDFQRLLVLGPLGAAVGAMIGGGAGAAIAVAKRPEGEAKKAAAFRGLKRGALMGGIFGLVTGIALRPPTAAATAKLKDLDDAVKNVKIPKVNELPAGSSEALKKLARKNENLRAVSSSLERLNIIEPMALASGSAAAKMNANANTKRAKAATEPEEKKKYELLALGSNVLSIYLATRIIGKCWGRVRTVFPEIAVGRGADAGSFVVNAATSSPLKWGELFRAAFGPVVAAP